ncbi:SDR family oxidoreductase [Paraeggerthella hongkongensis]|uniref:SDR family NAD(P)-dependent oxidoreductase n=1 Tax=Paraeggerthella hominis TaxID=2897351 RepID=UPI001C11FB21|nr:MULTISPECIES: SDR family oxidoreductase [Paraeggerthella]MBU5405335.1 SDR family oxidoreductase [Paraeggerthella hongkongensis]MCD2433295.1 SDR family oxidoreductase [Paraeggerthella hominis]
MGRLKRIAQAVLREMNYKKVSTVKLPDITVDNLLDNQLALITGGTSGIGLECARRFSRSGCKVVIAGSTQGKLEKALSEFSDDQVKGLVIDVRNVEGMTEFVERAAGLFPDLSGVSILVNSAGVSKADSVWRVSERLYDDVMDINLKGMFFMSQAVANHMVNRGIRGHILNVSSASALRPAKGPYEISKWGVKGMTLGLAQEFIKEGIVVNGIGPGPTTTPMVGGDNHPDNLSHVTNPSGRLAHPAEIANLALLLVSGLCDLVVGDTLYATGGAGTICIDR